MEETDRFEMGCLLDTHATQGEMVSRASEVYNDALAGTYTPSIEAAYNFARHGNSEGAIVEVAVMGRLNRTNGRMAPYNLDGVLESGHTLLSYAAMTSDIDLVEALLANGAYVNAKDGKGRTPVYMSTHYIVDSMLSKRGGVSEGPAKPALPEVSVQYNMDVWERMWLVYMMGFSSSEHKYGLEGGEESDGDVQALAWFVLDWYLKSGRPFNLFCIMQAFDNACIVWKDEYEEMWADDRLADGKTVEESLRERFAVVVPLKKEDWLQFRDMPYDFFKVPAVCAFDHAVDENNALVRDLVFKGDAFLCIHEDGTSYDSASLSKEARREGWGIIKYYNTAL